MSYFKRPKGQHGITQLSSQRMSSGQAIAWVLRMMIDDVPEDAIIATRLGDVETVVIDWALVPDEIRFPL